ncbi:MAG: LytR C-terminal domain-containing protein [Thermoleophilia bacterium]|nr:LytR C-terminal domain-containing protein [Thermoleophilia bacterium]MDH3724469.1 LytR C-terminal domain-containing protein [Thermoleophilia bacterium]
MALAALVVGFAAGWLLRGDGGQATVLRAAEAAPLADEAAAPAPEPEQTASAATARPRSEVDVAVLNGVGVAGLAGEAADGLRSSGYRIVQVDDGPARDGPTQVYFVAGLKPEAERLRRDLGIGSAVTALPDGQVRDIVPEAAQLVVLLGAG